MSTFHEINDFSLLIVSVARQLTIHKLRGHKSQIGAQVLSLDRQAFSRIQIAQIEVVLLSCRAQK